MPKKSIHEPAYRQFVENLAGLRRTRGMTQADFAKEFGRGQSFVSSVEAGSRRLDVLEYVLWMQVLAYEPAPLIEALDLDASKLSVNVLRPSPKRRPKSRS